MTPFVLVSAVLLSAAPASNPPPKPPPSNAECVQLPMPKAPFAFSPGEELEYDLDALGAQAGKMKMRVLPQRDGMLPIEVHAQTNTFFSKVRRVNGKAMSYLLPKTLRPTRYVEDSLENETRRTADVSFRSKERVAKIAYTVNGSKGNLQFPYGNDGLDLAGAVYLMRQLPLRQDMPMCFDVYGIRRIWRVSGKVVAREHVSLPLGEFNTWHLAGEAVRMDNHQMRREIHVWITDDERRLPVVALGAIDLGAVRATLTSVNRPRDAKMRAQSKADLKW